MRLKENVASIYIFINFLLLLVLHVAMRGAIPAIIRQRRGAVERQAIRSLQSIQRQTTMQIHTYSKLA